MKKTKIIATIGPASSDKEILRKMINNGMDIARINMAYSNYEFCTDIINKINELNKEMNKFVSIMLDLEGPDIKVLKFKTGSAYLNKGSKINIYTDGRLGDEYGFSVNYPKFVKEIRLGTRIKINDGLIDLVVIDKTENYLICEVMIGGFIENNKSINIIGKKIDIPFLSDKDYNDIIYADKMNVDFLALSFVSNSEDVLKVNDKLIELGNDNISIISKIENEKAVEEIDEIINVSDGVIVARGDLGVEIPLERVPGIQKMIISKCHRLGKVSIVSTEMMATMENNARPTRAEVNDVASSVLDSVDCVMLSGETTIGRYPVEAVGLMSKIIEATEEDVNYFELLDASMRTEKQDVTGSIAYSVVDCSNRLRCNAIVTATMSGYTARKLSRFRSKSVIIAMSPDIKVVKNLNLYYGIYPVLINECNSFDSIMNKSKEIAKNILKDEFGRIIITGGYPFNKVKHTNFMKIEEL